MKFQWALEWKVEDLWIGVFWKKGSAVIPEDKKFPVYDRLDIWICFIPCVPLHFVFCYNKSA